MNKLVNEYCDVKIVALMSKYIAHEKNPVFKFSKVDKFENCIYHQINVHRQVASKKILKKKERKQYYFTFKTILFYL